MPLYQYRCICGIFEEIKPIDKRFNAICPACGQKAVLKMSPVNWSFGWRFTEASNIPGHKDELEPAI